MRLPAEYVAEQAHLAYASTAYGVQGATVPASHTILSDALDAPGVRRYREARSLGQEAFADVLGVRRTYMGGVERSERNQTLRSVERMAAKLEVDPVELLSSQ
ncbi:helix-turn-helix transcriptional regulator [Microbacterium betulae]|uniref:Helix-turn-helix transcriptional regulator n=1 Tax=Microbacterium betulae TaxID=2981139 RepID=A0AA97FGI7_9MICO|nr:helix-turn-helix transcriptional regulator [Microbacterium sp. AB]WOF22570.1 helix-turn-helix transcriptional regulator [Microbacterium sp. AB]